MTHRAGTILLMLLLAGCTPELGSTAPQGSEGDDDDTVSAEYGCYTVGEDFWNDGFYVYRLDIDDGTAQVVVGPLDVEPYLAPSVAVDSDSLVGYDTGAQRLLSVDLDDGAIAYTAPAVTILETTLGLLDVDQGFLMVVQTVEPWTELRLYPSIDALGGEAQTFFPVQSAAPLFATDGDELFGLDGGTLQHWRLTGGLPDTLDSITLDLPDPGLSFDALELAGDEVVGILNDEVWRFDRATGDVVSGPVEIRAPGDAWFFVGLVCVEE